MKNKKTEEKIQYVIPVGNGWAIKTDGIKKFLLITDNKREAISIAKDIAKRRESKLIVYGKNGLILQRVSFVKKGRPISKAK